MKTPEKVRIAKRDHMRRARQDPEKHQRMLEQQRRCYANGASVRQKERIKKMQAEDPFRWRALLLTPKFGRRVTKQELQAIWDSQAGLCALTGKPMTVADADVDHVIPESRGGTHDASNLRWVWSRANEAKGNMLDAEFVQMCSQVVEWIGNRILEYERSSPERD